MRRRAFLKIGGSAAGIATLAGCLDGDATGETPNETEQPPGGGDETAASPIPTIEDPPDVIHKPTHREGMIHGEPMAAGEFMVAPMYAIPHEFLLMDTAGGERVTPESTDDLHLMVSIWDPETGVPFPTDSGLTFSVEDEDGTPVVSERGPWPMLSQGMGFHFGDNVGLGGKGTYTLRVELPPLNNVRRTGEFADRFESRGQAEFTIDFDAEFQNTIVERIEYLDESEWGEPGAIEPMHGGDHDGHSHGDGDMDGHDHDDGGMDDHDAGDMDHDDMDGHGDGDHDHHQMPYPDAPHADMLPGELLGTPESDGAIMTTTLVEPGSRFAEGSYLLVSPRTKYNSGVLPQMQLSAAVQRDGNEVATAYLRATLDHEAEFHYGAELTDVEPGDDIELTVETPPLVSRHMGYDTALMDMPPVTVSVPE